jgi:hypothetical protein
MWGATKALLSEAGANLDKTGDGAALFSPSADYLTRFFTRLLVAQGARDEKEKVSTETHNVETEFGVENLGLERHFSENLRCVELVLFRHKPVHNGGRERKNEKKSVRHHAKNA